jgi:hypothetical protein
VSPSEDRADIQQLGGSAELRGFLKELQNDGHISELVDGYRLCIAAACAFNSDPEPGRSYVGRNTMFAPTTLDTPDLAIRTALAELYPEHGATPYRVAEDLAEQGAKILKGLTVDGDLRFTDLLDRIETTAERDDGGADP